ncbi:MAG: LysR family transcriptional regulator [Nocardioides sp.]
MSDRKTDGLDDLTRWRTFLAVHQSRSISGAARALGLAQPSASAQISALEAALGQPLFERHARGVVPTAYADELAGRLAAPFAAVGSALVDTLGPVLGGAAHPLLRLGGPAELLAEVAAPALAPLVRDGVQLQITPGLTDDLLDALRDGRLDLVIATSRPKGRSLRAEPLADEELVLVGPAGGSLTEVRSPADLADTALLAYAADVPLLRRFWRHAFAVRLEVAPSLTVPDLRAVRAAVVAGAGVSVLPRYLAQRDLVEGRLLDLHPSDDPPISTTYLLTRGDPPAAARGAAAALRAATRTWG